MRARRHLVPGGRIRRSARPARGSRRPRVVRWPRPGFGRQFRRDAEGFAIRRQLLSKLSADGAWLSHSPQNRALDIAESFLKALYRQDRWSGASLAADLCTQLSDQTACKLIASCSPRACEPQKELYHRSKGTWPQSSRHSTNRVKDPEIEWIETLKGFTCGLVHRWTSPQVKPA